MKQALGARMPTFTADQLAQLKNSADFIGLNFYTASFVGKGYPAAPGQENPYADRAITETDVSPTGKPIGGKCASPWLHIVPQGIYYMTKWVHARYPYKPIMITENGEFRAPV